MEQNQLYILLVAILMVGSTIGFAVSSLVGPNAPPPTEPGDLDALEDQVTPPAQPATPAQYTVKDTPATVERFLPMVRLAGTSHGAGMDEIRDELAQLPGVARVEQAFFNQVEKPGEGIPVIAQLGMESGFDAEALQEALNGMRTLEGVQAFARAMLKVPASLELVNQDLNLVTAYTLPQPFAEAFVRLSTRPGDRITATLEVTLRGDELERVEGFEVRNLSAAFTPRTMTATAAVAALENQLAFHAPIAYTGQKVTALQDALASLEDVNEARVTVEVSEPIRLFFAGEDAPDANALANAVAGEEGLTPSVEDANDGRLLAIAYAFPNTYNTALKKAREALARAGIDANASVLGPSAGTLQGELRLNTPPSPALKTALYHALQDYVAVEEVVLEQAASFTLPELVDDANTAQRFDYNKPVQALVPFGAAKGDTFPLQVFFTTQRDQVLFASASLAPQQEAQGS